MAGLMRSEYWCHQCNQTILPIMGDDDICCPRCDGGFVEEIEAPPPHRPAEQSAVGFTDPRLREGGLRGLRETRWDEDQPQRMFVLEQAPLMMHMMQALGSALAGMRVTEAAEHEESGAVVVVDPMGLPMFMLAGGGANGVGVGAPQVLGDYLVGPGMEMLLQRLAENDPNRYGTPPTAKEAVEAMAAVRITEEHLNSECSSECAVCKEDFTVGEETRQLPCKHLYHPDCILPWLKLHSSCPVCRFQMPTEEEGSGKGQVEGSTSEGGVDGNGNGNGNGNENNNSRWLRISVPFSMVRSLLSSALGNGNNNEESSNGRNV